MPQTWNDVLDAWSEGNVLKYPRQLKGRFQWNTSVLKQNGNSVFKQTFRTHQELPSKQNKKDFQEKIETSKNPYVTSFPNLSGDTILVIPMPVKGKNYATLKDFMDEANETQQKEFWKHVAHVARKWIKKWGSAWISVHGLGVAYTHVRISSSPKYYFDKRLV